MTWDKPVQVTAPTANQGRNFMSWWDLFLVPKNCWTPEGRNSSTEGRGEEWRAPYADGITPAHEIPQLQKTQPAHIQLFPFSGQANTPSTQNPQQELDPGPSRHLHHHQCATFKHCARWASFQWAQQITEAEATCSETQKSHKREATALQGAENTRLLLKDQLQQSSTDQLQRSASPGKDSPLTTTTLHRSAQNLKKQLMNFALQQETQTFKVSAPSSLPGIEQTWQSLEGMLRRQQGVNTQRQREKEKREVIHTREVSMIKQVLQHCPVCIHEKVKSTSLVNKFLCLGLLLASFADRGKAGSTWENEFLLHPAALLVLSERFSGAGKKLILHSGVLYWTWAAQTSETWKNVLPNA